MFALSGRENGQDLLWHSSIGDFWPNFWLLQIDVDDPDNNPVRGYAHDTAVLTADEVCEIVDLLGEDVVIHTSDRRVAQNSLPPARTVTIDSSSVTIEAAATRLAP